MALPWLKKVTRPNQAGQPQQVPQPQMVPKPLQNGGLVPQQNQAANKPLPMANVNQNAVQNQVPRFAPDAAYAPKPWQQDTKYTPVVQKDLKDTVSADQLTTATNAAIAELIGSGPRDTSAEVEAAKKLQDAATQKALLDTRARAGFAGAGLSGAVGAIEGDTRRQGAQAVQQAKADLEAKARQEYVQNVALGAQTAAQAQQTEVEKQAWTIALQQLEKELQTDLNKDGVVAGADEAKKAEDEAKKADIDSILAGAEVGDFSGVPVYWVNADQKKQLMDAGITFTYSTLRDEGQKMYTGSDGKSYVFKG